MGNSPSALETCLRDVCAGRAGCAAFPGAPLYEAAWVRPYNLEIPVEPAGVIRPMDSEEVAAAVRCAVEQGVKVQAKSGGHSYANHGIGGEDGALVVDLRNLQSFSMDNSTWHATVGAGTSLGDLDERLHDAGGRAVAHGVCPGVGIGGHATIGGLGPPSRMWGSTLDHVVEVEVVTADGEIVKASEDENVDLFWALRGAGASFGIITEFTLRTNPEPGSVVQSTYTLTFGSHSEMAPVYTAWQDLVADPDLDWRFASEFVVQPLGVVITTTFFGTEDEWEDSGIPERIPEGIPDSAERNVSVVINGWLASLVREAGNEALYLGDLPTHFYSKSLAFKRENLLQPEAVGRLFEYIDDADKGTLLWFIIFDLTGGAVSDPPAASSSYPHRDKVMFYQSYAIGAGAVTDDTREFLEGVHEEIRDGAGGANTTYAGYVDPELGAAAAEGAYWGKEVEVLRGIKGDWDAGEVFWNPQAVRAPGK